MPLSPSGIAMCQTRGVETQAEGEGIHGRSYHHGVDPAKNVFQVHGSTADGRPALRKKLSRPQFARFMAEQPRWRFHSIPTSSSWLNAVEGFFAELTRRRPKYGVFLSLGDLQDAIDCFIAEHTHTKARPFVWRADPDEIIAARNRGFQMLESIR